MTEHGETAGSPNIANGLESLIEVARRDLTNRLGIDADSIMTVSAAAVVWPNPGLGCPRPGMQYRQVPVDGALIELRVGNVPYRYHSGGSTPPFLCENAKFRTRRDH